MCIVLVASAGAKYSNIVITHSHRNLTGSEEVTITLEALDSSIITSMRDSAELFGSSTRAVGFNCFAEGALFR
jgi:hypothetical protein